MADDLRDDDMPPRILFFEGLRKSSSRVRIWAMLWFLVTMLAAIQAVPMYATVSAASRSYEPGSLIQSWSETFRFDHAPLIGQLNSSIEATGAALIFLSMLIGVFTAGGWLQIFLERTEGHAVRRFFYGGVRYFWRFLRLLIVFLLITSLWGWIVYEMPWKRFVLTQWMELPDGNREALDSEQTKFWLDAAQHGLFAILFGLTTVWAIFARARMAAHDSRSVILSGFSSLFFMLRHPFRTTVPMAMILFTQVLVVGAAILAMAWVARGMDESATAVRVLLAFLLAQVVPIVWSLICRGARYYVAVQVTKEFAPAMVGPDPWKSSIGGPGGPRYPLDGDEYGVAL